MSSLIRAAMQAAMIDDLFHGQPGLEHRPVLTETGHVYEVSGTINPDRLGAFGADQIERVIERTHPGIMAQLQRSAPAPITEADVYALLEEIGLPGTPYHHEQAAAIVKLIADRATYRPGFDDL